MWIQVCFIAAACLFLTADGQDDGTTCDSPIGPGRCVPQASCTFLIDTIRSLPRPIPPSARRSIERFYCDSWRFCCPIDARTTTTTTQRPLNRLRAAYMLPLAECGLAADENRVQSGSVAPLRQYPWNVLLGYRNASTGRISYICGGSIISERYVLTAAHCINENLFEAVLGEHDQTSNPDCVTIDDEQDCTDPIQRRAIEQIIVHPGYTNASMWNDIALLRLREPADFTKENVKPICLPIFRNIRYKKIAGVIIAGWGGTENVRLSDVLRQIRVPVVDLSVCRTMIRSAPITDTQMCTGGMTNQNTCGGDSGSPLQTLERIGTEVRMVQYGIVSLGVRCPNTFDEIYGLHTRVDSYLEWIVENLR